MKDSKAILTPLVPLLSVAIISYAPANDSYKESLLIRQLCKGRTGGYHHQAGAQGASTEQQAESDPSAMLSPQDMLRAFKNEGFPIATIASMIGVERKTIYAWLDGSALKLANEERIDELYSLLNEDKRASYRSLYRYMNREVNGTTLSAVFAANPLDVELAREVLRKLWPMAEKVERNLALNNTKASSKNNPVLDESIEAFTT